MRVALVLILILGAVAAVPASAATRHAAPTGGATSGDCSATAPCDLDAANAAATAGDVVELASGTYERGDATLSIKSGVTYQGADQGAARPLITGSWILFRGSKVTDVVVRDLRFVSEVVTFSLAGPAGLTVLERVSMRRTQDSYPFAINDCRGSVLVRDSEFVAQDYGPRIEVWSGTCDVQIRNALFQNARGLDLLLLVQGGGMTGSIRNTAFNQGPSLERAQGSTASMTVAHSRVASLDGKFVDGGGNITAQPAFADPVAFDFHQTEASPTRDAGALDEHVGTVDIDGEPRSQGVAPDIGPDEFPVPPPAVATADAADVTQDSATLRGTVDPNARATTYWFAYGTAEPLTATTPVQPAGSGADPVAVSAPVAGLGPGTPFLYRLVAESDGGTSTGETRSFTTLAAPSPVVPTPIFPRPPLKPSLSLSVGRGKAGGQLLLSRRSVSLFVRCGGVPCSVNGSGRVRSGRRVLGRLAFPKGSLLLAADTRGTIRIRSSAALRRRVRAFLVRRPKARVTIELTATFTGADGTAVTKTLTIRVRRLKR